MQNCLTWHTLMKPWWSPTFMLHVSLRQSSDCAETMSHTLIRKCWISTLLQHSGLLILEEKLPGKHDWIGTSVHLTFVLFICSKATAAHLQMCVLYLFEWVLISERCCEKVHSRTCALRMWSGDRRGGPHDNKGGKQLMNMLSEIKKMNKVVDTGLLRICLKMTVVCFVSWFQFHFPGSEAQLCKPALCNVRKAQIFLLITQPAAFQMVRRFAVTLAACFSLLIPAPG